jgi:hypothetical protein
MSDAALKLRGAIHARLVADTELVGLLGGPRVHDEAPRAASGPYVTFDNWQAEDASTPDRRMTRHEFELALWAGQTAATGRNLAIGARIEQLLHDAMLTLPGHVLVFLYWQSSTTNRDERSKLPRLSLAFTALTEAL